MLNDFEKALSFFEKHEFEMAYKVFRAISLSGEFENSKRIESYKYAISCKLKNHEKFNINELKFELILLLYEEKEFSEIHEYLKIDESKLNSLQQLLLKEICWKIYVAIGEIEKAEKTAADCLKTFFLKGDSFKLESESERMKECGISKNITIQSEYMLTLLRGNEEEIVNLAERDIKSFYSKLRDRSVLTLDRSLKLVSALLERKWAKKNAHKSLMAWLALQEEDITADNLKKIAVWIFESLVENTNPFLDTVLLVNYSLRSKRFDFADIVSKNYQASKKLPFLNELVKKIEKEMVGYSEIEMKEDEDIDYATDLFRSENFVSYDSSEKVKKLEKEIALLNEEGHTKKVEALTIELEKLAPSHDLVKELYESKLFDEASRRLRRHKNIDEVREDLLKEIKMFSTDKLDYDEELIKSGLRKAIEYLDDDLFRSAQYDICVACLELGLADLANKVLEDTRGADTKDTLEKKWYLKIICLINNGEPFKALDFINEQILNKSLTEDDYLCFMYMKAEALRLSGKKVQALKAYKEVHERNPRYRLVRMRLKESV